MRVLHIARLSFSKSSGLTIIPKIVSEQNKLDGINSELLNIRKNAIYDANLDEKNFNFNYTEYKGTSQLKKLNKPDIAIIHTIYEYQFIEISNFLVENNIPYIVFPHGSLRAEAQKRKRLKKLIGNILFFKKIIDNSSGIQYLSKNEADNSKELWNKEYFVLGNGIDLPEKINTQKNKHDYPIVISFIGRLDIKNKGIDILLEALALSKDNLENKIEVNIHGTDQDGSFQKINQFIINKNLSSFVYLKQPVYDNDKHVVLRNTDIFVLLSRHEGLPTGVLEALSYGVPCLLTPGSSLSEEVSEYKSGWKTGADIEEVSSKINYIVENFDKYQSYRNNARLLAEEKFSWSEISTGAVKKYKEIIKEFFENERII